MTTAITRPTPVTPETLDAHVRTYIAQAKAPHTVKAYRADWQDFVAWCTTYGVESLPASAETLARYLTAHAAMLKVSTLQRRFSAINQAHTAKGYPRFSVLRTWGGVRRVHGVAFTPSALANLASCEK